MQITNFSLEGDDTSKVIVTTEPPMDENTFASMNQKLSHTNLPPIDLLDGGRLQLNNAAIYEDRGHMDMLKQAIASAYKETSTLQKAREEQREKFLAQLRQAAGIQPIDQKNFY
jgi:hypothetical protein